MQSFTKDEEIYKFLLVLIPHAPPRQTSFNASINRSAVLLHSSSLQNFNNRSGKLNIKHALVPPDFQAVPHPHRHKTPEKSGFLKGERERQKVKISICTSESKKPWETPSVTKTLIKRSHLLTHPGRQL